MKISRPLAALLGTAIAALPALAHAGSCTNSTRDSTHGFDKPSAETRVKNTTASTTLAVKLYRNETIKLDKSLQPGEEGTFTANFSDTENVDVKFEVTITPDGSTNSQTCTYYIHDKSGNEKLVWHLPSDADTVCPGADSYEKKVVCDKGYAKSKNRFKTTFTVSD